MKFLLILPLFYVVQAANEGSFSIPEKCNDERCSYKVAWRVTGSQVKFSVLGRVSKGQWIGVGFSRDRKMEGTDAIVAWSTQSDVHVVTDRFLFGKSRSAVPVDATNNLEVEHFTHDNGLLKFMFSRDIITEDPEDLSLNENFYIIFAWGGIGDDDEISISRHTARGVFPTMISLVPETPETSDVPEVDGMGNVTAILEDSISEGPSDSNVQNRQDSAEMNLTTVTDLTITEAEKVPAPVPLTIEENIVEPDTTNSMVTEMPTVTDTITPITETSNIRLALENVSSILAIEEGAVEGRSLPSILGPGSFTTSAPSSVPRIQLPRSCDELTCPPNSHCVVQHEIGRCYCDRGFKLDENGNCQGPPGSGMMDKCFQAHCPAYSKCMNGQCLCQSGYVMSGRLCIESTFKPRDLCTGVVCSDNEQCRGGRCTCINGFQLLNGKCTLATPKDECLNVKCPDNAACREGYCYCNPGFFTLQGRCQASNVAPQDPCKDIECGENSFCSDGRCECLSGLTQDHNGKCQASTPTSTRDECTGIKCPPNAECRRGFCFCKAGYAIKDGQCRAPNKNFCVDVRCKDNAFCKNGACVCKDGYVKQSNGGCGVPTTQRPPDECTGVKCPANAVCNRGSCFCKKGYVHQRGKCVATAATSTCGFSKCPDNAVCRLGRCYCKTGYISSARTCKKITTSTCTTLNCGRYGRCVHRNGRAGCDFSTTSQHHGHGSSDQQNTAASQSCEGKCGYFDYSRRCYCSSVCHRLGNCCSDYQYQCRGTFNFRQFHG